MEHRELVSDWLLPVARQVTDSAVALFPWNADSGADPDGDLIFDAKVSAPVTPLWPFGPRHLMLGAAATATHRDIDQGSGRGLAHWNRQRPAPQGNLPLELRQDHAAGAGAHGGRGFAAEVQGIPVKEIA